MNVGGWHAELLPRQPYETCYVASLGSLGFAFETQKGNHAFASDRPCPFTTPANTLAFVPAGCEVMSRSLMGGEYLVVSGHGLAVPENARRFNGLISPVAISAAHRLRACLLSGEFDDLELEELFDCLAGEATALATGRNHADASGNWMTPHRLAVIEEFIESRLGDTISVSELAARLDLSTGFFIRAFKAATGRSPHSYVIDRRLAHARRKLVERDAAIADVALSCGFASQAHMNALFRKRLGVTPAQAMKPDN